MTIQAIDGSQRILLKINNPEGKRLYKKSRDKGRYVSTKITTKTKSTFKMFLLAV